MVKQQSARADRAEAAFAEEFHLQSDLTTLPRLPCVGNHDAWIPSDIPCVPTTCGSHSICTERRRIFRDFAKALDLGVRCDTMQYMTTLNLRLPEDLKEQLEELSRQLQRPTSELVRESIRRYIVTEQLKAIRRVTVPLAEAQGFLTDEDIFKVVS